MSQILLPPAEPPAEDDALSAHTAAVAAPPRSPYEPEPSPRAPWLWRAIKWPLRNFLKGIYMLGALVSRHRRIALAVVVLLVVAGIGYGVYRARQPAPSTPTATRVAIPGTADTPFTISSAAQPPLAPAVIHWLHAYKTFNATEAWNDLNPQYRDTLSQQGIRETDLQNILTGYQLQGVSFEQFIYTGGYFSPDGSSNYTIQVIYDTPGQRHLATWYFVVDPNDQIIRFQSL